MKELENFLRKQLVKAKRRKDVRRSWNVVDDDDSTVKWRQWIIKRAKPVSSSGPRPSLVEKKLLFCQRLSVADEHHTCRVVHGYIADINQETKKVEAIPHAWNVIDGKHFDVTTTGNHMAIYTLTDDDVRDWLQNANFGWYVPVVKRPWCEA